jgi:hypothetical protein
MFANQVKGVAVGRNAGDGKTGDRYHVAVTYREDNEDHLHIIDNIEHEHKAWSLALYFISEREKWTKGMDGWWLA